MRRPLDRLRPVLVDNRHGNALASVIKTYRPALRSEGGAPSKRRSLFVGTELSTGLVLHGAVLLGLANNHRLR